LLAGVIVAGGCGEGGQPTASQPPAVQSPASAADARPDPAVSGSTRALVAEEVRDVQEGLVDGVPNSVCRELTEVFRARLERVTPGHPDCEQHVATALRRARAAGAEPVLSKIRAVRIDGTRAVVTIEKPDGEVQRIAVVDKGKWELPALDLGVPPGLQPIDR
jgi:hypothetical protein